MIDDTADKTTILNARFTYLNTIIGMSFFRTVSDTGFTADYMACSDYISHWHDLGPGDKFVAIYITRFVQHGPTYRQKRSDKRKVKTKCRAL